jgi:formyltetrahydrofolate-dependent phosphoribosylglycinamide formyltransferase
MTLMDSPTLSTLDEARAWRDRLEAAGQKLVFTNGVFDLLHAGHVRYLAQARALGDALVVALNSDASVRALKGPTRPLNTAEDRAEVLRGLRSVDTVVVFDGERCTEAIRAIRPHIYAKGGDYTPDSLNREEKAALDEAGGQIHILSLVPGRSTTATLGKWQAESALSQGAHHPPRLKLAVLGSGYGSNFDALLTAITSGSLPAEITLVLSDNRDARILQRAREAGIHAVAVHPGAEPNKLDDAAQKEICDRLRASGADLVILAGFMKRLREPVLSAFPDRILNIHPSLLPAFPGREAWAQALAAGATETGCTVHLVDAGMDTGRPLAQAVVPIHPGDTAEDVRARINQAEQSLYPKSIADYAADLQRGGIL